MVVSKVKKKKTAAKQCKKYAKLHPANLPDTWYLGKADSVKACIVHTLPLPLSLRNFLPFGGTTSGSSNGSSSRSRRSRYDDRIVHSRSHDERTIRIRYHDRSPRFLSRLLHLHLSSRRPSFLLLLLLLSSVRRRLVDL